LKINVFAALQITFITLGDKTDSYSQNRRQVIIGRGQHVYYHQDLSEVKSPLDLIEAAIPRAEPSRLIS